MRSAVFRGRVCHALCVRTHLHYLFSFFWQHFCLIVSSFSCWHLTLSLIKKCVGQKQLFYFIMIPYFGKTLHNQNRTQFIRAEAPSLGHHMVYPRLSHPSYELERTISHSNLIIYKHWHEEKILRKFTNEYFK